MSNRTQLSEAKLALLDKYLRGDLPQLATVTPTIPKRTRSSPIPLSFAQQQMWLLTQISPDIPVYNEALTAHLPGPLDVTALEQSLNEMIRRHEIWRTSFPLVDGQPVQKIHPTLTLTLPVIDLRSLPETEREAEALRQATEEAVRPFDLAHGPLLRATLMRLDDEDYRLFLVLHHIIFDGTIYEVFLPELRTHYEAFSHGRPSPLPPLPIQYADFAIWQREGLQGAVVQEQLAYWKRQLQDAPASLELPTDHTRPAIQTYRGQRYRFSLSQSLTHALKELSRREGATLYMGLLASCQILLHRYTGQDDILLGTTLSGRRMADVQKLLGPFLNVLVLRRNLSANPSCKEFLQQIRKVVLEAHDNQNIPFEYLVKELQPERNLAQNPLFQVMLSFEPPLPVLACGWTLTFTDVDTQTSKFGLSIIIDDRPEGLGGCFEYSTDLFEEATIARMVAHWQTLLESIVQDPSQRIEAIPLLTETERKQLISWNDTAIDYPQNQCLHLLFEAQVESTPGAVALIFEGQALTYRELNERANQLAHYLRQRGVEPEGRVGLCVERSLEMAVGLLGILKAGGAYVPLDPAYPQERLAFMFNDARIQALVTQQKLLTILPPHETVVRLDTDWPLIAQESKENQAVATTSESLLYIIYTSGSTGQPRGVMGKHRSAINRFHWMWTSYPFQPEEACCQKTSLSFVDSVWEIFGPMLKGVATIIIPDSIVKDPKNLLHTLAAHKVTRIVLVPSLLRALMETTEHLKDLLPSLKYCVSSGEALPLDLARRFLQQMPQCTLLNLYGSSEVAADVTCYDVGRDCETLSCVPLGQPIANTQIHILSRALQPVPIGVVGELYVGGAGLARGYFNQPQLTGEKFIPDPFSAQPRARLYKTGDLACYRPDGVIEFRGRIDNQVKLRGYRIELSEIEAALQQHPAVDQAVVTLREDEQSDKRLVAYIVLRENDTATIEDLKQQLMRLMPAYMIPSAFVLLDALPLTPNGKVNRKALPEPESSRNSAKAAYVAPTSLLHYRLVLIWEDLLGVKPIGIHDNFFSLGGHSLLATRLVNRIEQVFGKRLPLTTLFAAPTIELLARALQRQEAESWSLVRAVQPQGSKRPFFFLHGDYLGGAFYTFTLARALGMDQPFYALEPFPLESCKSLPTIEDIAKTYIQTLQTIQPQGPYMLGGFCNGGLIAYEIARQLQARGEQIALLVLIDPASPLQRQTMMKQAVNFIGRLLRTSSTKQVDWFLLLRHIYKYLEHQRKREDIKEIELLDPTVHTLMPTIEALRQDNLGLLTWIVADYTYDSYAGQITMLWAREEPFDGIWHRKAAEEKNIELDFIPGTHKTCLTDHVLDLAEKLKTALANCEVQADRR